MLSSKRYYILSFTWGFVMSLLGVVVSAAALAAGYKPTKNVYGWVFKIGNDWGGVSFGPTSVVCKNHSSTLLRHEFGHSIQNCYLGPVFIFAVAIPSAIRYWYREFLIRSNRKTRSELAPYDGVWFEGAATKLGMMYEEKKRRNEE